jgi:hypothetical protein
MNELSESKKILCINYMKQLAIVSQKASLIVCIKHVLIVLHLIYFGAVPSSIFPILGEVFHEFFFIPSDC